MVELFGCTRWLPVACTVPTPWLMEMLVVCPLTCQRKVEDWPR